MSQRTPEAVLTEQCSAVRFLRFLLGIPRSMSFLRSTFVLLTSFPTRATICDTVTALAAVLVYGQKLFSALLTRAHRHHADPSASPICIASYSTSVMTLTRHPQNRNSAAICS